MTDWIKYLADRKTARTARKDRTARRRREAKAKAVAKSFPVNDSASYRRYLRTHHWRRVRKAVLAEQGGECSCCGRVPKRPHVHHVRYNNLWRERRGDLTVLCGNCHNGWHFGVSISSDEQKHLEACALQT